MTLLRRIKAFDAVSYLTGIVIATLCWWTIRPMIHELGMRYQLAFTILFIGGTVGIGTMVRVCLMVALPKSYWDSP